MKYYLADNVKGDETGVNRGTHVRDEKWKQKLQSGNRKRK